MEATNLKIVHNLRVYQDSTSAITKTASTRLIYATETTIAKTALTKANALITLALVRNSIAPVTLSHRHVAFLPRNVVISRKTVLSEKTKKTVHHRHALHKNSSAITTSVYHPYGCATKTTIAGISVTKIRTRPIAILELVTAIISGVIPEDVFRTRGNATAIRIVRMRKTSHLLVITPTSTNANRRISNAETESAFPDDGIAITRTIAATIRTRSDASRGTVPNPNSSARMDVAYRAISNATASINAMIK